MKLPTWATPALAFNNTTSLPLLLIQSLEATGILDMILRDGDSASSAVSRAESYFLINSMVNNSLTFALGPRLLRPGDEDAPDKEENEQNEDSDEEEEQEQPEDRDMIDEETTLLPQHHVRKANSFGLRAYKAGQKHLERLPPWAQSSLDIAFQFANAPLIGAAIGAFIGLIPPLHRLFFNEISEGGYLNAWLTTSIKNIGDLFASLQIIVVGVKLSQSLRNMKRGEESGPFSWTSFIFITCVRFIIWPAYVCHSHTRPLS
jgi:predicted permease